MQSLNWNQTNEKKIDKLFFIYYQNIYICFYTILLLMMIYNIRK